jgi:transposase
MPAPLAIDLRRRLVRACDAKRGTQAQIARMFGVTPQCLSNLLRRRRETGSVAPAPHGGGHPPAYAGEKLEQLRELVRQQPDATLEELRERTGVACSLTAVHNALKRLNLRYKKSRCGPASRTVRT